LILLINVGSYISLTALAAIKEH